MEELNLVLTFFSTPQSAEGCNRSLRDLRRCSGSRAGPWPHVCAGRGEGMRRGGVGARGRRPAGTEVSAVASESPGATPSKPWLLLLTPGRFDGTRFALQSDSLDRFKKSPPPPCLTIASCLLLLLLPLC